MTIQELNRFKKSWPKKKAKMTSHFDKKVARRVEQNIKAWDRHFKKLERELKASKP